MEEKKEEGKLSYERLQEICGELSQRLQKAYDEIRRIDASNAIQRLNYLFKVLENYAHFDADFVEKCTKEIQDIMTPAPEETEKEEKHES